MYLKSNVRSTAITRLNTKGSGGKFEHKQSNRFRKWTIRSFPKYFQQYLARYGGTVGKVIKKVFWQQPQILRKDGMISKLESYLRGCMFPVVYVEYAKDIPAIELHADYTVDTVPVTSKILSDLKSKGESKLTSKQRSFYVRTFFSSKGQELTTKSPVSKLTPLSDEYPYIREQLDKILSDPNNSWVRDLTAEGIEPNPGPRNRRNGNKKPNARRRRLNRRTQANTIPTDNTIISGQIMPSRKMATLRYLDGSTVRNSPGSSFLVYSMRINDLYDPDPAILSGSVSNFKEMMQFYGYYRVMTTGIKWTVINLENFPLSCGIVFSQVNLTGVISSLGDCQNAFENDFAVNLRTIAAKGGIDKTEFSLRPLSISRLLGVGAQYRAEQSYAGSGLATPAIPLWANFIVFSPTGAVMANGYINNTTLAMRAEFFGRLNVRS